jgi:hypothetical protein
MHNVAMENVLEKFFEVTYGNRFFKSLPKTSAIIPIGITSTATRQSAIANDIKK